MRPKLVLLALLFTLFPFHRAAAQGGFVNVTATVLDPNGVPYAGCHGTIDFVTPANALAQPTLYRGLFPKNFSISQCDSFGKFSLTLAATDQIDCGLGTLGCGQWHFSITSQDGKTGFQALLSIGPGNPNQITNEDISSLLQTQAAPLPISSLSQFLSLNNNWTGANSFSKQITSTVATGTAPFSIASTTVVPNLNAQLHNGLTAPASAIVGVSDTQTLTNKSIDCTANTLSKNPCVVYSTVPAATTVGISATTMATAGGSGNTYRFGVYADQTVLGASCASNTTVTTQIIFTDPNSSSTTTSGTQTFTIVNNGTVGTNTLLNSAGNQWLIFRAKASTTVQFATTVSGGTSCSPPPTYQIYPILEQIQ